MKDKIINTLYPHYYSTDPLKRSRDDGENFIYAGSAFGIVVLLIFMCRYESLEIVIYNKIVFCNVLCSLLRKYKKLGLLVKYLKKKNFR